MKRIRASQTELALPSPAVVYDERFVPALFAPWSRVIVRAAQIDLNQHVLDVACGTGVLACAAADRVGPAGKVAGLDPNSDMLAVARRKSSWIEWRDGRAEALPWPGETFDAVVSQFGMMFFDSPSDALREMMRVLRPGGHLAVAVCDALDHSPGYAALAALLQGLFGPRVADAFRAPFALGDAQRLRALCDHAGMPDARVEQRHGTVRFASIDDLISTERACAWTLGGLLDDAQFERLLQAAQPALSAFADKDGSVAFEMPALLIVWSKP
jgi:SAM-dependent methyltransferase